MEDERQEEFDCIAAIFPEIAIDPHEPFSASIEIAVNPQLPVKVVFPISSDGTTLAAPPTPQPSSSGQAGIGGAAEATNNLESHNLSFLPSLQLRISLPEGYPEKQAPDFKISTSPPWLSRERLDELESRGREMWEEGGRSVVVFGFIDSLQQAAENAFGFSDPETILEIPQDYKISLLDYDIKAKQAAFDKETFDCGVCLDPKKGSVCHRMIDCGHVFCVQCLQDFYNNAITEGDLVSVRCLTPECAKKRAAAQTSSRKKARTQLSPSELLQIPLEHEIVTRYVKLKHKADLESDKNTIYCPRKWCQGAARSKKHRKPDGLEDTDSGEESESESGKPEKYAKGKDLLAVCEDCTFAFCSRCYQGWHGEFTVCIPQTTSGEMTDEDKASLEYLKAHSTPCPTCAARAQKTHGCNHMICFKCNSHFCYLCSAWLEPGNPYKHYNQERTSCYMRLWELEDGDGDDHDREAGRQVRLEEMQQRAEEAERGEDVVEAVPEPVVAEPVVEEVPVQETEPVVPQAVLQREGPLVLRINQLPRPAPAPAAAPVVAEAPQAGRRNHRNGQHNARQQPGGPRRNPNQQQQQRVNAPAAAPRDPAAQAAAQQAWVQMFVQMALNDEEDLMEWDSDDEDHARWNIPVR